MSKVSDKWAVNNIPAPQRISNSRLNMLRLNSSESMMKDLKALIEQWIDTEIRKVIAYEEKTVNGGFCSTCSFEETVIDIYFKSNEGVLCCFHYEGTFADLMLAFDQLGNL